MRGRGRVRGGKRGIRAQMPRQLEGQLHAGRKFRETLVDAELEIKGAIEMAEHDRCRDGRRAGMEGDDFALTARRQVACGLPDEGGVAFVLLEGRAAPGLPTA